MIQSTYKQLLTFILVLLLMSGCLYPDNELSKNQVPNEKQVEQVQSAVEQYNNETQGLLPIKTKASDTPIFQKYLVDFQALKERNIISETPGSAYENGGHYQYAILTPEEEPRVKVIDLRMTNTIRDLAVKLEIYRDEHIYPPFGEEIADGVFRINYEELGLESQPYVTSPYSQENLPIVMDQEGNLYVDYRIDINQALEASDHSYEEGDDIRYLLAENTPFMPAYSLPYTIRDGEPVFNLNDNQNN